VYVSVLMYTATWTQYKLLTGVSESGLKIDDIVFLVCSTCLCQCLFQLCLCISVVFLVTVTVLCLLC